MKETNSISGFSNSVFSNLFVRLLENEDFDLKKFVIIITRTDQNLPMKNNGNQKKKKIEQTNRYMEIS